MKILFSHFGVYKKGGWGRTFPLAKGLVELGEQVTLLTTNPNFSLFIKRVNIDGVNIIVFPDVISNKLTTKGFGFLSLLLKIIYTSTHKFEIVHSDVGHRPSSGIPCRVNKRLYHSIYIAEWWDFFGLGGQYDNKHKWFKKIFGSYELRWEKRDKEIADGIVVLSRFLEEKALKFKNKSQVTIIHGGANVDKITYVEDNSTLKLKLGLKENCLTIGYLDAYDKTLDELSNFIEVYTELVKLINIKLLLFGMNLDSKTEEKLGDDVIKFGWINFPDNNEIFAATDVFIMLKEENNINAAGWPNKIGEYMACGRPIILNPVGEMIEFIKIFNKSFFAIKDNKEEIKKVILDLYSDRNKIVCMGKVNRDIAERKLSWPKKSGQLLNFYKEIKNATTNSTT